MSSSHPRRALSGTALAVLTVLGCVSCRDDSPSSGATTASSVAHIESVAQLPDPCTLVDAVSVDDLLGFAAAPQPSEPVIVDGKEKLFRTCMWGSTDDPSGAVGIQIGVPDSDGVDVIARRARALDPALESSIGTDGKQTMFVGELPTGGGLGTSIYFRHSGYSVLIGLTGAAATMRAAESLALQVISTLDG
jgi:hypothetical protein